VARNRSFTRAAEQMHISQAGLSLMIRELENQLACRLFDRTTRSVLLTSAGQALMPLAERMLEELAVVMGRLEQIGGRTRNTLRVGATPLLSAALMPLVYKAMRTANPELAIRVTDTSQEDLHRRIESGELDCAVGPFYKRVPGIERSLLFSFELLYIRASRTPTRTAGVPNLRWRDLPEAPLLRLPPENPVAELIAKELKKRGLESKGQPLMFNHVETIIAMAAAGAGSAIIPSIALAIRGHEPLEVARLIEPTLRVGVYLITKRGRQKPAVLPQFTGLLLNVLPQVISGRGSKRQDVVSL
jgi:DNA-binding transcriptional LysR family regulator